MTPSQPTPPRDSADPRLYMRIVTDVRQQLTTGAITTGNTVSITHLARQWATTRDTASRALQALQRDGLLKCYPGFGYIALPQPATDQHTPVGEPAK